MWLLITETSAQIAISTAVQHSMNSSRGERLSTIPHHDHLAVLPAYPNDDTAVPGCIMNLAVICDGTQQCC